MTVKSNSKENGAKVHLWRHNPAQYNNEIVTFEMLDYNVFRIKFKHSNKYLTLLGNSNTNGETYGQKDWGNHASQKFSLTQVK